MDEKQAAELAEKRARGMEKYREALYEDFELARQEKTMQCNRWCAIILMGEALQLSPNEIDETMKEIWAKFEFDHVIKKYNQDMARYKAYGWSEEKIKKCLGEPPQDPSVKREEGHA